MGNLTEPTQWQALRLRATAFLLAESEIDSSSIWNTVIGGVPDEEQRRPKEGLLQQVGTLADLTAVMRMAHPRVDFFLQPTIQNPGTLSTSPDWQAFSFSDALQTISEMSSRWFSMQLQVARVAFGANLVQPADDLRDAHRRLADYLSDVTIDSENSFDFFYQINRRRESKVIPQLPINRLSKWSIMTQATGSVAIQSGQNVVGTVFSAPVTQAFASSLELDINTVQANDCSLPESKLCALFGELLAFGKEVAEEGDVA